MTLELARARHDRALLVHADWREAVRVEVAAASLAGELMRNDQARAWPNYTDAVRELSAATAVLEALLLDQRRVGAST